MYHKKRKSHKKHHTKKRRSIGATGKASSMIMEAAGLIGGAVAARFITTTDKIPMYSTLQPNVKNASVLALGYFFPKLVKGSMGKSIGLGMITAGGLGLVQSTGIIAGLEDSMTVSVMAGDDLSVIAGYSEDNMSVIAGMDEEDY
jgi:hypothetical protein